MKQIEKLQTANERCKFIAELALSAQCNKQEYETALGLIIDIADVNKNNNNNLMDNDKTENEIQIARFKNMKIEVLLDKNNQSLKPAVIEALEKELKSRVTAHYPDAKFRIAESSNTNIQVLGASSDDRDKVMNIIQELWESNDWIPEEV